MGQPVTDTNVVEYIRADNRYSIVRVQFKNLEYWYFEPKNSTDLWIRTNDDYAQHNYKCIYGNITLKFNEEIINFENGFENNSSGWEAPEMINMKMTLNDQFSQKYFTKKMLRLRSEVF